MGKNRSSNIELLRIICMALVILHHFAIHTGWGEGLSQGNRLFMTAIGLWPAVAINCFVMISGYFMCAHTGEIRGKLVRLWKERVFYSLLITLAFICAGLESIGAQSVLQAVFPIVTCRHNYVTTFVFLYLLIPFVNRGLAALDKRNFTHLVAVSTLILSVLPSFVGLTGLWVNNTYAYLLWMIYLYCLGAYFRRHPVKLPWLPVLILSALAALALACWAEPRFAFLPDGYILNNRNNILLLICSAALLNLFVNLKCGEVKWINWVAGSTFAVLLIHDDPLMRRLIWKGLTRILPDMGGSPWLWACALGMLLGLYAGCVAADKLLSRFVRRPLDRLLSRAAGSRAD